MVGVEGGGRGWGQRVGAEGEAEGGVRSGGELPSLISHLSLQALGGSSVTIFAYGQTGSGKTHTMSGPETCEYEQPLVGEDGAHGLIPRVLTGLFDRIREIRSHDSCGSTVGGDPVEYEVRASYLEIYNETLNDLLNPASNNLQLRETQEGHTFVQNLLQVECRSVDDAMLVLAEASLTQASHQSHTSLTQVSHKSHTSLTRAPYFPHVPHPHFLHVHIYICITRFSSRAHVIGRWRHICSTATRRARTVCSRSRSREWRRWAMRWGIHPQRELMALIKPP